jgi:hypothetical protein
MALSSDPNLKLDFYSLIFCIVSTAIYFVSTEHKKIRKAKTQSALTSSLYIAKVRFLANKEKTLLLLLTHTLNTREAEYLYSYLVFFQFKSVNFRFHSSRSHYLTTKCRSMYYYIIILHFSNTHTHIHHCNFFRFLPIYSSSSTSK